ncbi:MAG: hypothetical protein AAFO01_08560 [Pseudomonadota bacterium]
MHKRGMTLGMVRLAAMAVASLALLPITFVHAAEFGGSSLSTRLFLGRINNWMIWEFDGNDGRFCFITSSPMGTSPLRIGRSELWVTQRPIENDHGGREHVFEVSFQSEKIVSHDGEVRIEVGDQELSTFIKEDDRIWLDASVQAIDELLRAMIDREAVHADEQRRDPRSELTTPMLTIRGIGGTMAFVEQFSLLGFTEAKAVMDDHCPSATGPT